MNVIKKIVAAIVSISLFSSISITLSSSAEDVVCANNIAFSNNISPDHLNKLLLFSQMWNEEHLSDTAQLSKITTILNPDNSFYGYQLSFEDNTSPRGYVVIEIGETPQIVDFSLSGGDIQSEIKIDYSLTQKSRSLSPMIESSIIYRVAPYNYGVVTGNHSDPVFTNTFGYAFDCSDKIGSSILYNSNEETVNSSSGTIFSGFFDRNQLQLYSYNSLAGSDSFVPSVQSDMPEHSSNNGVQPPNGDIDDGTAGQHDEGNCVPTTLTNIIAFYDTKLGKDNLLISNNRNSTYNQLSTLVGYHPSSGTNWWNCGNALTQYCSQRNYSCSVNSYLSDSWSDFVRDINAGLPILTNIRGNINPSVESGHTITTIGWATTYSGVKYLRVIDCWNNHTNRYIIFKGDMFTSFDGCAVVIN